MADHTYQELNNNDDCPICNRGMYSTDQLGSVFLDGKRLLAHWICRKNQPKGNTTYILSAYEEQI